MTGAWHIESYTPEHRTPWNDFARSARAPHFFFQRDYLDHQRDRLTDASLLAYSDSRLVALLPATREGDVVTSHAGLTFGGFITDTSMTIQRMLDLFSNVSEFLAASGARELVYAPVPHIYHLAPAEEDLYALFRADARLVRREASVTFARDYRSPMASERRRSIARASRSGLTVSATREFTPFMDLVTQVLATRHGARPTHSPDEIELLARHFPDNIALICASRAGALLAGTIVYQTPRVWHAQYLASSPEGRDCGALDAVIVFALEQLPDGCAYFDLGTSRSASEHGLDAGLVRYKQGFGGRSVMYDCYAVSL